jgi:hypothetical protein
MGGGAARASDRMRFAGVTPNRVPRLVQSRWRRAAVRGSRGRPRRLAYPAPHSAAVRDSLRSRDGAGSRVVGDGAGSKVVGGGAGKKSEAWCLRLGLARRWVAFKGRRYGEEQGALRSRYAGQCASLRFPKFHRRRRAKGTAITPRPKRA